MHRSFLNNNFAELEMLNPNFPIRIREAQGTSPAILAQYSKCL
jgi:hypothetical protein